MLAKTVQKQGRDWDEHLPYLLYANRTSIQESTKESPFYLLYGRDARLPTDEILNPTTLRETVNLDDYRTKISQRLAVAWDCARNNIKIHSSKRRKNNNMINIQKILVSRWEKECLFICLLLGKVKHTN